MRHNNRNQQHLHHRFKATCGTCGDVELGVEELDVEVRTAHGDGIYAFRCPGCFDRVAHPAPPRLIDLLISTGVTARSGRTVADGTVTPSVDDVVIDEHAIDEAEVAAFVSGLDRDDVWFAELLA